MIREFCDRCDRSVDPVVDDLGGPRKYWCPVEVLHIARENYGIKEDGMLCEQCRRSLDGALTLWWGSPK